MAILSLQSVSKEYASDGQIVRALDGVTLEVQQVEFVALVGRSGCGKSTLLNLAVAMDFPTTGTVEIGGQSSSSLSEAQLTSVRREVAIARALAHAPAILLADEPTGNLDSTTGGVILELLLRLTRERKTATVMATHSLEAAVVCDTLVRMRDGRIEEITRR